MGQSCGVASATTHGLWVAFQVQTVVHSSHCGILTFAVLGSVHGHLVQVLRVSVIGRYVTIRKCHSEAELERKERAYE